MSFPTIVVADHEPSHGELLSEIVMDEGYPHVAVVSVEELWPLVTQTMPGLVLLDMGLNSTAGWRLLEQIRRYPPTIVIPVILFTTNARPFAEQAGALQRQHCFILAKPFDISVLLGLVTDLLGPPPPRWERDAYQHDATYAAHHGAVLP